MKCNTVLNVPKAALDGTVALLRRVRQLESGVLWYGRRDQVGNCVVDYVVAPKQKMHWGNYLISTQALSQVVARLPEGSKPLAQIHSHPSTRVEHSNYDDRMIVTRRALSIVFPNYGHWTSPFPHGLGIHESQNDYWYLLDDATATQRVVITPAGNVKIEDFR
ncbi:MAG: Mov34/MPN/PAD-1 family protein [Afipia sp.]|nr:Mov34/MPN/PAD-1 family protein [Afipia sp.]